MSSAGEKLRKAREFKKTFDGLTLRLRRPTEREYGQMERAREGHLAFAERFVVDWEGVTEADLWASGGAEAVPFDLDVWHEYIADRHELWEPISKAIAEAFQKYFDEREERAKN